jgi:2-dehydro-3-deoxyglucarate aldolase/4-hydroxy-2-oxoheptanedioate aldolase
MISEVRNPNLARMLATAGLDSMIIDMEHGTFDWPDMSDMIAVARGTDVAPVVRIPEIRRETVLKPLDAGASGLLVPMINSPEEAEEVVRLVKYPPAGARGTALRRGHSDYRPVSAEEYLRQANDEVAILLQIETFQALEQVDDLAAIEGVDALFVGPSDLSVDMGIPGKVWDRKLREAYSKVITAGKRHGVATGIQMFDVGQAKELVTEGVRYLSFSSDVNLLIDYLAQTTETLREGIVETNYAGNT